MPLPFPNPTNVTSLGGLFQYADAVTFGLFGPFLLFAVWIVFFLVFSSWPASRSLSGASYVTLVAAVFLWAFGLVGATPVIVCVVAVIASSLYLFWDRPRGY